MNAIVISIAYNLNDNAINYGYQHNGKNIRYVVVDSFAEWAVRDHSALFLFIIGLSAIIAVIWCSVCHSNNQFDKRMDDITKSKN